MLSKRKFIKLSTLTAFSGGIPYNVFAKDSLVLVSTPKRITKNMTLIIIVNKLTSTPKSVYFLFRSKSNFII